MEGPLFSTGEHLLEAGLVLGTDYLPNLVASAFLQGGTRSGSGSDSEANLEFVSSEFGGVDSFKSDSNSLISFSGCFGFGPLWMGAMDVGFKETWGGGSARFGDEAE